MRNHYAVWLVASGLLSSLGLCGRSAAPDLAAALEATSPNPSLGDQAQVLGRLVGTWDVKYTDFPKDGKAIHRTGEFILRRPVHGRPGGQRSVRA